MFFIISASFQKDKTKTSCYLRLGVDWGRLVYIGIPGLSLLYNPVDEIGYLLCLVERTVVEGVRVQDVFQRRGFGALDCLGV